MVILTDRDALNLTAELEVLLQVLLVGAVVDILHKDAALVGVVRRCITVLRIGQLAFLILACKFNNFTGLAKTNLELGVVVLTLFELLFELLKLLLLLGEVILVRRRLLVLGVVDAGALLE